MSPVSEKHTIQQQVISLLEAACQIEDLKGEVAEYKRRLQSKEEQAAQLQDALSQADDQAFRLRSAGRSILTASLSFLRSREFQGDT